LFTRKKKVVIGSPAKREKSKTAREKKGREMNHCERVKEKMRFMGEEKGKSV